MKEDEIYLGELDDFLTLKNYRPATRKAYRCALKQFQEYIPSHRFRSTEISAQRKGWCLGGWRGSRYSFELGFIPKISNFKSETKKLSNFFMPINFSGKPYLCTFLLTNRERKDKSD